MSRDADVCAIDDGTCFVLLIPICLCFDADRVFVVDHCLFVFDA